MSYKKGNNNAFLLGMKFSAGMAEAQYIAAAQHAIDDETFKKDGFKTAEEFITDGQQFSSYDVFRKRSAALKQLGMELTRVLLDAGFTWNRIRTVEHLLPEDIKNSARNKNVVPIDGTEISLDNKEAVVTSIKMLLEQRDGARKIEKHAKKELESLKKEYDSGNAPLIKELEDLKALAGVPDTPEKVIAGFERIDKAFSDLETVIRTFVWKDAKKLILEDGPLQARVQGIQEQMRARVDQLIKDWDAEVNNE